MKNWTIGAISGGLAGIVGGWLMSEYDFSLLLVVFIGAMIGLCVGMLSKIMKKKSK